MKNAVLIAALALAGCGSPVSQAPQNTPPRSNVIAFMGDSITQFWGATLATEPFAIVDYGVSGNTTTQMLARFQDQVINALPITGVVVIDGGINDWFHNDGTPVTIDNIAAMARMAQQAGIRVIIASVMLGDYLPGVGITIQPTSADVEAFDQQLISLCAANGYIYADYFDAMLTTSGTEDFSLYLDGVHPNAAGYARMWTVIEPLLEDTLQ